MPEVDRSFRRDLKNLDRRLGTKTRWIDKPGNLERHRELGKVWQENNRDKTRASCKKWYENNKEKALADHHKWESENKDKVRLAAQNRRNRNLEVAREKERIKAEKYRKIPKVRLSGNMSRRIRTSLRNGKAGTHWEELVGYTVSQLRKHIEKRFKSGMTWDNYGIYWHIDHKTPIAVFNYETPEDIDFRLCWSLKNLQPLEKSANQIKNAKVDKPFQPSLSIGGLL